MAAPTLPPLDERMLARSIMRGAASRPRARAINFPAHGVGWSYSELELDARRMAGGLQEAGLERGDRVAIMLSNQPEYVLTWVGCAFAGLIDVAVNHRLVGDLLAHQLRLAGARAVVCDASSFAAVDAVAAEVSSLELALVVGPPHTSAGRLRVQAFATLLDGRPQVADPIPATEVTTIRYTSGTTGPAKAVALTGSQMSVFAAHPIELLPIGAGDRLYTPFPLHHSLASILGVVACLQAGACCAVDDRFRATQYWERVRRANATRAQILFPMVNMLLAQPASSTDRDHGCSMLWTAPLNPEFDARFGVRTITHYSMTEGNIIAYLAADDLNRPGTSGRVSPLFHVRIVDGGENELPSGERGEILWRPRLPNIMMAGYYGDPAATVAAWRNLWFHSGDEGYIDADGYLYLIGRMGDQIRRKGVNIPAEAVEAAALKHPAVRDAAAIAVPAEVGESEIKLAVVANGAPPEAAAFHAFLRRQLPPEMVPRYLEFRESLPRTGTMKVSKQRLRDEGERGLTPATLDLAAEVMDHARNWSTR